MRIVSIFLLLLALGLVGAAAKTVPIPGQGASITIPDDWILLQRPNVALVAAAPGETTAVGVLVSSNTNQTLVDSPAALDAMEQGLLAKAKTDGYSIKVVDDGPRVLNGVPAGFVQTERAFSGNRTVYSRTYNMAANGKLYLLTLDTRDPLKDPELQKIAESFRFDTPPRLPGPSDFLVHRIGEIVGVMLLLTLAAFLLRLAIRRYARD